MSPRHHPESGDVPEQQTQSRALVPLSTTDVDELADQLDGIALVGPINDDYSVTPGRIKTEGPPPSRLALPEGTEIVSQTEVTIKEIFPDIFEGKANVDPFKPLDKNRKKLQKEDIVGQEQDLSFWNMLPENVQEIILKERKEAIKRDIEEEEHDAVVIGRESPRKARMRAKLKKKLLTMEEKGKVVEK